MTVVRLEQSVNRAAPQPAVGSRRHRRGFWVVTILGFGIAVALGIAAAAIKLLRSPATPAAVELAAAAPVGAQSTTDLPRNGIQPTRASTRRTSARHAD